MNRRGFLTNLAGAVAAPAVPSTQQQQTHGGMCIVGRWMIDSSNLHIQDARTAYIRALAHEGPQIRASGGLPQRGDAVRVFINWDVCLRRGQRNHRPLAKLVLRVKPVALLREDAEIHTLQCPPIPEDSRRALWGVSLHASNDWWLIRVTAETRDLATQVSKWLEPQLAQPIIPPPMDRLPEWEAEYSTDYTESLIADSEAPLNP